MHMNTENLFLYVKYNMPFLSEWEPRPAVLKWKQKVQHRERDCPKRKQQTHFLGVFKEASECHIDSDSDEEKSKK